MPFIIAGILYVFLAVVALTGVGAMCLLRRQPPLRSTIGAAVGSLVGFLLGCGVGALACFVLAAIGMNVGATLVVVPASLGAAVMGAAVGAGGTRQAS